MMRWLKKLGKGRKRDNRGLTLVELICSVAILGVVCTAVGSVMVVSARTYGRSNDEVSLQQEAQLTANQIADLVIDTTSQVSYNGSASGSVDVRKGDTMCTVNVTRELQIQNGSTYYTVSYGEGKLVYKETLSDGTVNTGLLAENVEDFQADVSDFSKSGNARLYLAFKDETEREYAAWYTITARNGGVDGSGPAILNSTAQISTVTDITLEPNESYDLKLVTSVYGTAADKTVTWSDPQSGGATSSSTRLIDGVLTLGQDETGNDTAVSENDKWTIKLTVSTNAKAEGGVTPLDVKTVTVHVRRVKDISLSTSGVISGVPLMKDAVYRVSPVAQGSNFARVLGVEYDDAAHYKNPYYMSFKYEMTINGTAASVDEYIEITGKAEDSATPYLLFKLKQPMPAGGKLVITAAAKHPLGSVGGVQTNKTGAWYANVEKQYILEGPSLTNPHNVDGGLRRGTQQVPVGFHCPEGDEAYLKTTYKSTSGNQGQLISYWRYRAVGGSEDSWTDWFVFNEQGTSFHIQPGNTINAWRPDVEYEIQIESRIMFNSEVCWPKADTPLEYYHSEFILGKAYFTIDSVELGFDGAMGAGTRDNPVPVNKSVMKDYSCLYAALVGTDGGYLQEKMGYKLYKVEDGIWEDNSRVDVHVETNKIRFDFTNTEPGLYKVVFDWKTAGYVYSNEDVADKGGIGYFYFKVVEN